MLVNFIYFGSMTAFALFVIGKLVGNRVSAEDEIMGLDIPELGLLAYPDDMSPHHLGGIPEDTARPRAPVGARGHG